MKDQERTFSTFVEYVTIMHVQDIQAKLKNKTNKITYSIVFDWGIK